VPLRRRGVVGSRLQRALQLALGRVFVAGSLVLAAVGAACGSPLRPSTDHGVSGTVLYLRAEESSFSGTLTAWSEDGGARALAAHVAPLEFSQPERADGRLIFSEASDGPLPQIKVVDLKQGSIEPLTRGHYPRLSDGNEFSYCDQDWRTVVADVASPMAATPITSAGPNCLESAWSRDGQLALLIPVDGLFQLYLRPVNGGGLRNLPLSVPLSSAASLSWSSDSQRIAASTNQGIALIDLSSGDVTFMQAHGVPRYSPTDPGVLAVLDSASESPAIDVFRGRERVATKVGVAGPLDLAWSPDGKEIAFVGDESVGVWDWTGDGNTTSIESSSPGSFVQGIAWTP
jgi:WD40 repeat protein